MKFSSVWISLTTLLVLAGCVDENATVLRGTFVEEGAPGEYFMQGDATKILRCVYNGGGNNPGGVSGSMIEYPRAIGGGVIRARDLRAN